MRGQKHLIECHCVLPLYKGVKPIVYHKFSVYSKIDDAGKIIPKYVNCNNCGITHLVYELCKSEIKVGSEEIGSVRSIQDIEISLPEKLVKILSEYNATIDLYEEVEDVIDNDLYPSSIVLKRDIVDDKHNLKILNLESSKKIKILSETIQDIFYIKNSEE